MNTYAINVVRGKEFLVEEKLIELGLQPWVPKVRSSRYIKEAKRHSWFDRPYVPKLMFCVIPAIMFTDVVDIKEVVGKPMPLSRLDMRGDPTRGAYGLNDFKQAVEAEYDDACRKEHNTEYECKYVPGQALKMLEGPFEDFDGVFKGMVQSAHDEYAKLSMEIEMFGAKREILLDPDGVAPI